MDNAQYSTIETGYPGLSPAGYSNPRDAYDRPVEQRGGRFKMIDPLEEPENGRQGNLSREEFLSPGPEYKVPAQARMPPGDSAYARSAQLSYHNFPRQEEKAASVVPPFKHLMKRPGNADRMREIFGGTQNFDRMNEVDFSRGRQPVGTSPQPSYPSHQASGQGYPQQAGYTPRMKIIGADERQQAPSRNLTPDRRQIYEAINDYFPGFIMSKVKEFGNFSVYKGVAQCMLCDGVRYVVAIVTEDGNQIGTKRPLNALNWVSFQCRYSEDDSEVKTYRMSSHSFAKPETTILDDTIRLSRTTSTALLYQCDNLPLNVEILKQKEDDNIAETGTVASALELWQTVISFGD